MSLLEFPIGADGASEAPRGVSLPVTDGAPPASGPERVVLSGRESCVVALCLILSAWGVVGGFALRGWVEAPVACTGSAR